MRAIVVLSLLVAVVASYTTCPDNYVCRRKDVTDPKQCYAYSIQSQSLGAPCDAPDLMSIESLTYLDKNQMRQVLSTAWQRDLNTNQDPANGKWFENGANGDQIGLYGGLTDSIDSNVYFDEPHKAFSKEGVAVFTADADNRDGLNPSPVVTLSYTHSFTQTQTHSTTHQFKSGIGIDFKAQAEIFGIGGDVTTKFSFDYTYSFSDTTSTSETDTTTFTTQVPLKVPKGEVYRVVLEATRQRLTVPTFSYSYVTGTTETWFESRVNGHYDWTADAATMWSWINKWSTAGSDSPNYDAYQGRGRITFVGSMYGQNYVNMCSKVYNITDSFAKFKSHDIYGNPIAPPAEYIIEGLSGCDNSTYVKI